MTKIKTESPNGTILVRAQTQWGALWSDGGKKSKGKKLFLRDGKLCFGIALVGVITGTTYVADGQPHEVGLLYAINENKFRLMVDG